MTTQQIAAPFSRLFQGIGLAMQSWTMRRELDGLDDRMLKDLGISRAQAEFDAARAPGGWNALPWHIGPHHDA